MIEIVRISVLMLMPYCDMVPTVTWSLQYRFHRIEYHKEMIKVSFYAIIDHLTL